VGPVRGAGRRVPERRPPPRPAGLGWDRWVDDSVSLDRFGASAPGDVALANLGYTPGNVADRARQLLDDLKEDA
jgi:hypothetical protein